jgi:hypothetical protein
MAKKRDSVGSDRMGPERSRDVIAYRNSVISPRGMLTSNPNKGFDPKFENAWNKVP